MSKGSSPNPHAYRHGIQSFVTIGLGAGLSLLMTLALTQFLGTGGYGTFAFGLSVVTLAAIPAGLGLNWLVVRSVARYHVASDLAGAEAFLRSAALAVSLASISVAVILWLGSLLPLGAESGMLRALLFALPLVPLLALFQLIQGALEGIHRAVPAQFADRMLIPTAMIVLVFSLEWLFSGVTAESALIARSLAVFLGMAWLMLLWRKEVSAQVQEHTAVRIDTREALPFLIIGLIHAVYLETDILMLGVLRGADETGIYRLAAYLVSFVSLPTVAIAKPLSPLIAALYNSGQRNELERQLSRHARLVLILTAGIAVAAVVVLQTPILHLFGDGFVQAKAPLLILMGGLLVGTLLCPITSLLGMTAHARDNAVAVGLTAMANIVLNWLMIPYWGMVGAAWATSMSLVMHRALLAFAVWHRLSISMPMLAWDGVFGATRCGAAGGSDAGGR